MNLSNPIKKSDITHILSNPITIEHDMILEIISDWSISSEESQTYKDPLSYLIDELHSDPETYDFTYRDLCIFIIKYFK